MWMKKSGASVLPFYVTLAVAFVALVVQSNEHEE
jgi:hypothetical protein